MQEAKLRLAEAMKAATAAGVAQADLVAASAAPAEKEAAAAAAEEEDAVKLGDQAEVVGLESEGGKRLNGMVGVVRGFVEDKDRYRLELGPDNFVSVRPANLRKWPTRALPVQPGQQAVDPAKEEPLKIGERVEIFGLESESGKKLNGRLGWTLEFVAEAGRFKLELTPGEFVSVKAANLKRFIHEPPDETRDRSLSSSSSSKERRKKKREQKRKRVLTPEEVLENLVKTEERAARKAAKSARDAGAAAAAAAAGNRVAQPSADAAGEAGPTDSAAPPARDDGTGCVPSAASTTSVPVDAGLAAAAAAASAAVAAASPLKPGDRVEVHGLQSAAGKPLNGKTGMIIKFAEDKGRFQVELGLANVQSLKPANLRLCKPPLANFRLQELHTGSTAGYTLL